MLTGILAMSCMILFGLYMYMMGLLAHNAIEGLPPRFRRKKVICIDCQHCIPDSNLSYPRCKMRVQKDFVNNRVYFGLCESKNWTGFCRDFKPIKQPERNKVVKNG